MIAIFIFAFFIIISLSLLPDDRDFEVPPPHGPTFTTFPICEFTAQLSLCYLMKAIV